MKKIIVLTSMITLIVLTGGWTNNKTPNQISDSSVSDSSALDDTASRGYFECVATGQCTVLDGGGKIRHFANWSGDAPDRPAAINNVKEEWYRTARNRGCTKDFEIILVSCQ